MARLIDANSILDDFLKRYTEMERNGNLVFAACEIKQDFANMISNAPTIDAVPVVRCKDCKYFKTRLCENEDNYDDWFCADGERKDEVTI